MGPMDLRKKQLAAQLAAQGGLGAPVSPLGAAASLPAPAAARQQQLMAGMGAAGPGPQMGGPMAPPPGMGAALGAPPAAPPPMMDAGPAPQVGGPPMASGPLSDQIRQDYVNSMKAPMQQAGVPMNKWATGLQALGAAGTGLAAMGDQGNTAAGLGAGVGAGSAMLANYLKDRRGRKNIGTSQFAKGGVVRLAQGGAAKERKNYPNTTKPRGMGKATRGHNFKGSV